MITTSSSSYLRRGAGLALLTAAAVSAHAQSLEAFQGVYPQNNGVWTGLDGHGGANGPSNPYTWSRDFTGLDQNGDERTMSISGSAYSSASYGKMHVYGSGSVTNALYNASNPVMVDSSGNIHEDGIPDFIGIHGNAGWSDTLTYSGLGGPGYYVNYFFRLEGTVSGASDIEAGLNFWTDIPGSPSYNPRTNKSHELWVTPNYDVTWGVTNTVNADFYAGLSTYLSSHSAGDSYTATADYGNTVTLVGIVMHDSTGKVVDGWSVNSGSGTQYAAVPEPASCLALTAGIAGLLARRRRR